jgi:hypothetical protein
MDDRLERLKSMLNPRSLFFVPEADTQATILWAIGQIDGLKMELEAAKHGAAPAEEMHRIKEELRVAKQDRKDLREELALWRQLVTLRSDAVKKIADQLIKKAT